MRRESYPCPAVTCRHPWGKEGPKPLTPLHIPVGAQGAVTAWQDRARARGARPGSEDIPAPACCATFGKHFLHWPQRQGGQDREADPQVCGNVPERAGGQRRAGRVSECSWYPVAGDAQVAQGALVETPSPVNSRCSVPAALRKEPLGLGPRQPPGFLWAGSTELVSPGQELPSCVPGRRPGRGPGTAALPGGRVSPSAHGQGPGPFPSPLPRRPANPPTLQAPTWPSR